MLKPDWASIDLEKASENLFLLLEDHTNTDAARELFTLLVAADEVYGEMLQALEQISPFVQDKINKAQATMSTNPTGPKGTSGSTPQFERAWHEALTWKQVQEALLEAHNR